MTNNATSTTLDQFKTQRSVDTGDDSPSSQEPHESLSRSAPANETEVEPTSATPEGHGAVTSGKIELTGDIQKYLIKDQMGSLLDALREAGQNGIDSPGSEKVLISVAPERSVVIDDGAGIDLSSSEGQENLTVLGAGTKDEADNDTIGQFGIGKGPVISKGAVRIWSQGYELFFDYEDRRSEGILSEAAGPHWALQEAENYLDGLMIEIDHYESEVPDEDSYEWRKYRRKLRKRFKFAKLTRGIDVVVNGKSAGADRPGDSFTSVKEERFRIEETDEAYIAVKHNSRGGIKVYSNGIYVTDASIDGLSGTVVSKDNLTLNFARNAIQDRCSTWSTIREDILSHRDSIFDGMSDSNLSTIARSAMVEMMSSDPSVRDRWEEREIIKLANEGYTTLRDIETAPEISWAASNTKGADKLVERGYTVLDESDAAAKHIQENQTGVFTVPSTFDATERALEEEVWTGYERIEDERTLNARQQQRLLFARAFCKACGEDRDVYFGKAEAAAYTDGRNHITITETATTATRREIWMHELYIVLCHEMVHEQPDTEQPSHGTIFCSSYYDAIESRDNWAIYRELVRDILDNGFETTFQGRDVHLEPLVIQAQ